MECKNCKQSTFAITDGVYTCTECGFQAEETRHETSEYEHTHHRNLLKSSAARQISFSDKIRYFAPWTTTEAYNLILCKQVTALIDMGVSKRLKNAVLFLWSHYLQKSEVAFQENPGQQPKLNLFAHKRDKKILYGDKVRKITKRKSYIRKKPKKSPEIENIKIEPIDLDEEPMDLDKEPMDLDKEAMGLHKESMYLHMEPMDLHKEPMDLDKEPMDLDKEPMGLDKEPMGLDKEPVNETTGTITIEHITVDMPIKQEQEDIMDSEDFLSSFALGKKGAIKNKKSAQTHKEMCPDVMTLPKTIAFLYLGLQYCDSLFLMSDLIKFIQEGRIPYINVTDCFPPHMELQGNDLNSFQTCTTPDLSKAVSLSNILVDFLQLSQFKQAKPLMPVVARFVKDLNLPDCILPIIKMLLDAWNKNKKLFSNRVSHHYLLYEVQALAAIIVALKTLFVLDGDYEREHSQIMMKVNILLKSKKMFIWEKWQQQAALKEFLFLKDGTTYSDLSTLDMLNAEQIVAKYPFTTLRNNEVSEHDKYTKVMHRISIVRKNVVKILSEAVPLDNVALFKSGTTFFPLMSNAKSFAEEWRKYPFFGETGDMDVSLLTEDFSSHRLFHSDPDEESEDLVQLLLSSVYESSPISTEFNSKQILRTSSNYWFKNLKCAKDAARDKNWIEQFPGSFKWLLKFLSKYMQVSCLDLYSEVVCIEKAVHSHFKHV